MNKGHGLLEGGATYIPWLPGAQSKSNWGQNRTEQSRGQEPEKKRGLLWPPLLYQEKPRGVILAVWENVLLFEARTEVHTHTHTSGHTQVHSERRNKSEHTTNTCSGDITPWSVTYCSVSMNGCSFYTSGRRKCIDGENFLFQRHRSFVHFNSMGLWFTHSLIKKKNTKTFFLTEHPEHP